MHLRVPLIKGNALPTPFVLTQALNHFHSMSTSAFTTPASVSRLTLPFPAPIKPVTTDQRKIKMVRYLNPGGHNLADHENFDGYGISLIVVIILYSIFFYVACTFLWLQRNNPAIRMRKIPLALLSILVLHVYLVIIFVVYPLNGTFPCGLEFWIMSIYLPIGIGLFQAQNQQLLIVSREQNLLKGIDELYRPLYPNHGGGLGGPKYWIWRLKLWWRSVNAQNRYEGLVFVGMVVQV